MIAFRADDAGAHPALTAGALETAAGGLVRSISVMVPPPAFGDAVPALRALGSKIAIGLHVTLNCEWPGLCWHPSAPADKVPDLIDDAGFFRYPTPAAINAAAVPVEQLVIEVRAQLAVMRRAGIKPAYLDEHMGVGWVREHALRRELQVLCAEEDLVHAELLPHCATAQERIAQHDAGGLVAALRGIDCGAMIVVHPAVTDSSFDTWRISGQSAGPTRDAERQLPPAPSRGPWSAPPPTP